MIAVRFSPRARQGRSRTARRSTPTVAGDGLLHPGVLASIGVCVVNDHVLKAAAPGWLTGKLSDVTGLVFFPLLLVAGWELLRSAVGRRVDPSARSLILAVLATGVAFAAVKTTDIGAAALAWGLGSAQWLVGSAWSGLTGSPTGQVQPVQVVRDPTDLVALLALGAAAAIGLARARRDAVSRPGAARGSASGASS